MAYPPPQNIYNFSLQINHIMHNGIIIHNSRILLPTLAPYHSWISSITVEGKTHVMPHKTRTAFQSSLATRQMNKQMRHSLSIPQAHTTPVHHNHSKPRNIIYSEDLIFYRTPSKNGNLGSGLNKHV